MDQGVLAKTRGLAEIAAGTAGFILLCAGLLLHWSGGCFPASSDFGAPLVGDYALHRTSGRYIDISPSAGFRQDTPRIPATVVELAHDARFIVAKQQPSRRPSASGRGPSAVNYWILDTAGPKVFGPLALRDFESMRARLEIDSSLAFRDVDDFRPWHARTDVVGIVSVGLGVVLCGAAIWARI